MLLLQDEVDIESRIEKTAMDYLNELEGGIHSLQLVELLNKISLGLQIYNEHTKEMESWLLGLAPDFPKGRQELKFDWWPDHEIRRYFRLPDTRACFIPGYFLRVFVNMVNNKGYELREGYGNAAKMSKTCVLWRSVLKIDKYVVCQVDPLGAMGCHNSGNELFSISP